VSRIHTYEKIEHGTHKVVRCYVFIYIYIYIYMKEMVKYLQGKSKLEL
jgi:hypothetical protein